MVNGISRTLPVAATAFKSSGPVQGFNFCCATCWTTPRPGRHRAWASAQGTRELAAQITPIVSAACCVDACALLYSPFYVVPLWLEGGNMVLAHRHHGDQSCVLAHRHHGGQSCLPMVKAPRDRCTACGNAHLCPHPSPTSSVL
eukprot:365567-Chlamydomonas_euryale.AAC.4